MNSLKVNLMRYFSIFLLSIVVLGFHSCGMVTQVREQGNSKSWVVAGTKSIGTSKKEIQLKVTSDSTVKKTISISPFENRFEPGNTAPFSVAFANLPLVKANVTLNNSNETTAIKPQVVFNPIQNANELIKCNDTPTNAVKPQKNRSIFYGLLTTLSVLLMFVTFVLGLDSLFFIFMVAALVLTIISIIHTFIKPEPSLTELILTILLFVFNLITGLVLAYLWAIIWFIKYFFR